MPLEASVLASRAHCTSPLEGERPREPQLEGERPREPRP